MNNRPSYYSVTSLTEEFGTTDLEPIPHSRVRDLICFVYLSWIVCLMKLCGFIIVSRSGRQLPETVVHHGTFGHKLVRP